MEEVEVVVAHSERATLRVGDVFLKIDADQARTEVEVEAMAMARSPCCDPNGDRPHPGALRCGIGRTGPAGSGCLVTTC